MTGLDTKAQGVMHSAILNTSCLLMTTEVGGPQIFTNSASTADKSSLASKEQNLRQRLGSPYCIVCSLLWQMFRLFFNVALKKVLRWATAVGSGLRCLADVYPPRTPGTVSPEMCPKAVCSAHSLFASMNSHKLWKLQQNHACNFRPQTASGANLFVWELTPTFVRSYPPKIFIKGM